MSFSHCHHICMQSPPYLPSVSAVTYACYIIHAFLQSVPSHMHAMSSIYIPSVTAITNACDVLHIHCTFSRCHHICMRCPPYIPSVSATKHGITSELFSRLSFVLTIVSQMYNVACLRLLQQLLIFVYSLYMYLCITAGHRKATEVCIRLISSATSKVNVVFSLTNLFWKPLLKSANNGIISSVLILLKM